MNTSPRPFGQLVVVVLMLVSLMTAVPPGVSAQGNSDAAHLCQKGGWEDLQRLDGTIFANQDECVSYAAEGGTLQPRSRASVVLTDNSIGVSNYCCGNGFQNNFAYTATGFLPWKILKITYTVDGWYTGASMFTGSGASGSTALTGLWQCAKGGSWYSGLDNVITITDGTNTASVTQTILC